MPGSASRAHGSRPLSPITKVRLTGALLSLRGRGCRAWPSCVSLLPRCSWPASETTPLFHPSKHPALRFWPSARGPPSPALESLRGTLHSRRASQGSHGTSCSPDIQTKLCSLPVETATPEVLPRVSLHSLLLQLAYIRPHIDGAGVGLVQYFSVNA